MRVGILIFLQIVLLCACGYKPISHSVRENLGDKVYISVKINTRDPQNSVILKDELSKKIIDRLHADIVNKEEATTIIEVELKSVNFSSLAENRTGFATFYSCLVEVQFKYSTKDRVRIFNKNGFHNFSLQNSSIITDQIRMDAINVATIQALDGFISQIGVELR